MKKVFLGCMLFVFLLSAVSCNKVKDLLGFDDNGFSYPTVYPKLSPQEISRLQQEFNQLNSNSICTKIDEWGKLDTDMCFGNKIDEEQHTDETALELVRSIILKNSRFTGASSVDELENFDFRHRDVNNWVFTFDQYISGYPVVYTSIQCWLDAYSVYRMSGSFYSNVYLPDPGEFDRDRVNDVLVGYKETFMCWTPMELEITKDQILGPKQLVVYPWQKENCTEVRLAWDIPIGNIESPYWKAYVDAVTYELIDVVMVIIC